MFEAAAAARGNRPVLAARIFDSRLAFALLVLALACCTPRPDVFLITVDTLRADRLGVYGSSLGLTPEIDALAAESLVFEDSFAPASFTLPSVSALLTGRHPEQIGMWTNGSLLSREVPTLAELLSAEGWRTGAVVSNFVLRQRGAGLERGFDEYDDDFTGREANRRRPERIARHTTDAALRMLDGLLAQGSAPVFLWVHYQDPHGPYTPPEEYRYHSLDAERALTDGGATLPLGTDHSGRGSIPRYQQLDDQREVAVYRAAYDGEVRYVDAEIGRLLAGLRERGRLDEGLVVLTADHGEGLGEHDYWFAHGEYLSDPLVRVPLLIRAPGIAPARRRDVATHIDLVPTLLARLGIDPGAPPEGRDLLAPGAEHASPEVLLSSRAHSSVARFGLIAGGYKYLVEDGGPEQLHPLGQEGENLAATEPERLGELRQRLRALRIRVQGESKSQPLSADVRRELEALGYVTEP